jgi:hypothetical protein
MKFKHYKGGEYGLVTLAKDEASHDILVVYRSDDGQVWSRPAAVFFSRAGSGPRFVCVPPAGFEFCCDSGCEHVTPYPKLFEFSREEHPDGRVDSKTKPYWACHFCGEDAQLYESATGDVIDLDDRAPTIDLPPRVLDVLWQSAGVSSYHPDGDQAEKLRAYGLAVAAETLARRPV